MVSGTCALPKLVVVKVEGKQGSSSKGVDDLCFHIFPSPPLSPLLQPPGPYLSPKAHIPAFRPIAHASWLSFGPWGWHLGLGTGIQALRVAQGQYVVSNTHCPALHDCELE